MPQLTFLQNMVCQKIQSSACSLMLASAKYKLTNTLSLVQQSFRQIEAISGAESCAPFSTATFIGS